MSANRSDDASRDASPPRQSRARSFWTGLPGIITAVAGLITAIGGVIGFFHATGSDQPPLSNSSVVARVDDRPGVTRSSYIRQADDICQRSKENIKGLGPAPKSSDSVQKFVIYLRLQVDVYRGIEGDLRALAKPSGDEATLNKAYDAYRRAVAHIEEEAATLERNDYSGYQQAIQNHLAANREWISLTSRYGMSICPTA